MLWLLVISAKLRYFFLLSAILEAHFFVQRHVKSYTTAKVRDNSRSSIDVGIILGFFIFSSVFLCRLIMIHYLTRITFLFPEISGTINQEIMLFWKLQRGCNLRKQKILDSKSGAHAFHFWLFEIFVGNFQRPDGHLPCLGSSSQLTIKY
jgi:hypothetical protein